MAVLNPSSDNVPRQPVKKKYKESCNNCAASKVKCNRDKPQCSRCEDRDLQCDYSLSQRSGRRPVNSQNSTNSEAVSSKPQPCSREGGTEGTSTPKKQRKVSKDLELPMLPPKNVDFNFCAPVMPMDTNMFDTINPANMMAFDTVTGPMTTKAPDAMGFPVDMSYTTTFFPELMEHSPSTWLNELPAPDLPPPDMSINSCSSSIYSRSTSLSTTELPPLAPAFDPKSVPCNEPTTGRASCCSMRTAELLNRLRGEKSQCYYTSPHQRNHPKDYTVNFEEILNTNRECLTAVMGTLDCPCSAEQQVVFLVSMIIFEVLDRYSTTAVEDANGSMATLTRIGTASDHGSAFGKYQVIGPDARRMRAALILGELHLVVRLLDRLSQRSCALPEMDHLMHGYVAQGSSVASTPVSPSVFIQVEADMKKKLGLVRDTLTQMMRDS